MSGMSRSIRRQMAKSQAQNISWPLLTHPCPKCGRVGGLERGRFRRDRISCDCGYKGVIVMGGKKENKNGAHHQR